MLKNSWTAGVTLLTALTPLVALGQNDLKIGYVNAQAIIAESPEAASVEEQFQREMVPWEGELQSIGVHLPMEPFPVGIAPQLMRPRDSLLLLPGH